MRHETICNHVARCWLSCQWRSCSTSCSGLNQPTGRTWQQFWSHKSAVGLGEWSTLTPFYGAKTSGASDRVWSKFYDLHICDKNGWSKKAIFWTFKALCCPHSSSFERLVLLSDPEGLGTFKNQRKTFKFKTLISPHVTTVTSLLSSHFPEENKESFPATKVCWWSVDKVTS